MIGDDQDIDNRLPPAWVGWIIFGAFWAVLIIVGLIIYLVCKY